MIRRERGHNRQRTSGREACFDGASCQTRGLSGWYWRCCGHAGAGGEPSRWLRGRWTAAPLSPVPSFSPCTPSSSPSCLQEKAVSAPSASRAPCRSAMPDCPTASWRACSCRLRKRGRQVCARRLDDGLKRRVGDGHRVLARGRPRDGHRGGTSRAPRAMAIPVRRVAPESLEADERLGDAEDGVSVDEILLSPGGFAQGGGGDAVNLAQGPLGVLVEGRERVVGEDGPVGRRREPESDVLGRAASMEAGGSRKR